MQTGIATTSPAPSTSTPGRPGAASASAPITASATIAPIMVISPWAKLMSSRMPYTMV